MTAPLLYGLDIETDTTVDGLDPQVGRVLAVAVAGAGGAEVLSDADEAALLIALDARLADLPAGVLVTWNGARFDLPYLATRADGLGVDLGLVLEPDRSRRSPHTPLPGPRRRLPRARWHHHAHLDVYRSYQADVGPMLRMTCSLKAVARLAGLVPIEVDAARVHALAPAALEAYVASDARLHPRAGPAAVAHRRFRRRRRRRSGSRRGPTMSPVSQPRRRPTSTSNFGVGRREGHDASAFYERFSAPVISDDEYVEPPFEIDEPFRTGDSRQLDLPDNSVALVVTSPPYYVGKDYEIDVDNPEVPASYGEYLRLLHDVFAECVRVLEPGGRIAVNVANLGRKPYRSLSADVIRILQDDLGLLLRGEVIWKKSEGATGNCAWGSFRSASNPVLRDVTERVVIAGKGRFDRAIPVKKRAASGWPSENSVNNDEFMAATLDVWDIPPESATRVGHPAPFPVELPERLIHLYTYEHDLVLDPFMGSGTTLLAAAKLDRRYVGCDLDPAYVDIARRRVEQAMARHEPDPREPVARSRPPATTLIEPPEASKPPAAEPGDDFQARASREGKAAQKIAETVLERAGFQISGRNVKARGLGVMINLIALDAQGRPWNFDVTGAFTTTRGGLLRTDSLWKALGRASVLAYNGYGPLETNGPVVLLTSHLPRAGSDGDRALRKAGPGAFFDAIEMLSDDGQARLADYAHGGHPHPLPGFWTERDLDRPYDPG